MLELLEKEVLCCPHEYLLHTTYNALQIHVGVNEAVVRMERAPES